jgi:hypothetical protein
VSRASKLLCLAAMAIAVSLAATVQSASAATGWHFGPLVKTWINDCYTFDVVNGVGEYSGALYDAASPPKTGDVFYVNVVDTGIDSSCAEITFPEIKLPAGMATAISPSNPIRCYTVDTASSTETPDTADCPSSLGAPLYGGTGSIRNVNGPSPGTWDTRAPKAWEFKIPVTASTAGQKTISFPTQVISGSITQMLEPDVSVPIVQGPIPPPPPPPPHNIVVSATAKSAKVSSSGALAFLVSSSDNGTARAGGTVTIPGSAKVVRFATRTFKLSAGKKTKIALKLSKKNARTVRNALRHKKLTAKIVVTAKGTSGGSTTSKLSLALRR